MKRRGAEAADRSFDGARYLARRRPRNFARSFSVADAQIYPGMSKVVDLDAPQSSAALKAWVERVGARAAVRKVYKEVAEAMGGG